MVPGAIIKKVRVGDGYLGSPFIRNICPEKPPTQTIDPQWEGEISSPKANALVSMTLVEGHFMIHIGWGCIARGVSGLVYI